LSGKIFFNWYWIFYKHIPQSCMYNIVLFIRLLLLSPMHNTAYYNNIRTTNWTYDFFSHSFFFRNPLLYCVHYCQIFAIFYNNNNNNNNKTKARQPRDELTKYYYGSVSLHYSRLAHKSSLSIIIFIQQFAEFRQLYYLCIVRLCGRGVY